MKRCCATCVNLLVAEDAVFCQRLAGLVPASSDVQAVTDCCAWTNNPLEKRARLNRPKRVAAEQLAFNL